MRLAFSLPEPGVEGRAMNRCALCGAEVSGAVNLCPNHHAQDLGWAATNRVMCNFLHRGALPPRVSAVDRSQDLPGCLQEAA
jgi:hypothetical protein